MTNIAARICAPDDDANSCLGKPANCTINAPTHISTSGTILGEINVELYVTGGIRATSVAMQTPTLIAEIAASKVRGDSEIATFSIEIQAMPVSPPDALILSNGSRADFASNRS